MSSSGSHAWCWACYIPLIPLTAFGGLGVFRWWPGPQHGWPGQGWGRARGSCLSRARGLSLAGQRRDGDWSDECWEPGCVVFAGALSAQAACRPATAGGTSHVHWWAQSAPKPRASLNENATIKLGWNMKNPARMLGEVPGDRG